MKTLAILFLTVLLLTACAPAATSPAPTSAAQTSAQTTVPSPEPSPAPSSVPPTTVPDLPKDSSAVAGTANASEAPPESGITGLMLILGIRDFELVDSQEMDNGNYRETCMYDGMVSIVLERMSQTSEFDRKSVTEHIKALEPGARDMDVELDDDQSMRLSYPAWEAEYITGRNEDTRINEDLFIQTDNWDFRMHVSTPIDWHEDYEDIIDNWFDMVTLDEV